MAKISRFFFLLVSIVLDFYRSYIIFYYGADIFSRPTYVPDTVYAELYARQ